MPATIFQSSLCIASACISLARNLCIPYCTSPLGLVSVWVPLSHGLEARNIALERMSAETHWQIEHDKSSLMDRENSAGLLASLNSDQPFSLWLDRRCTPAPRSLVLARFSSVRFRFRDFSSEPRT
jgi:hypothetical protein